MCIRDRLGLGKFTYTGIALKLLITSSCDRMKIRLDGKAVHTFSKVLFACGMNGPYEGGGFKFAPEASVDAVSYTHLDVYKRQP